MARFIDAEILAEEIGSLKIFLGGRNIFEDEAKKSVLQIIDEQETVNSMPVVQGKWNWKDRRTNRRKVYAGKKYDELCDMTDEDCKVVVVERYVEKVPRCSICGLRCDAVSLNYCSNCGAKMDLEDNE